MPRYAAKGSRQAMPKAALTSGILISLFDSGAGFSRVTTVAPAPSAWAMRRRSPEARNPVDRRLGVRTSRFGGPLHKTRHRLNGVAIVLPPELGSERLCPDDELSAAARDLLLDGINRGDLVSQGRILEPRPEAGVKINA